MQTQAFSPKQCALLQSNIYIGRQCFAPPLNNRKRRQQPARARGGDDQPAEEKKGLFDFVTNNPSSRTAVYQDDKPEVGEVGAVGRRTKDRGQDYGDWWGARSTGSTPVIEELTWFIREIGDSKSDAREPPTLFLHGVPSQSYSFLPVLHELSAKGWHAYAPDWIGFGYSEHTQPKFGFNFTEKEYHTALQNMLDDKAVAQPLNLVAHGFITGQYAVTWALANPEKVAKLVIIDMPLSPETKLPLRLQPLKIPFAGAMACQDALIAERTLESGTPYEMSLDDADIYRFPYLSSSQAGVCLLETVKQADLPSLGKRLSQGLSKAGGWSVPTLILTGDSDKFIKTEEAEAVAATNPGVIKTRVIEAAGHQPQEDYPTQVTDALVSFLR